MSDLPARHAASPRQLYARIGELESETDTLRASLAECRDDRDRLRDGIELAWGIIANAGGGNWERESKEWREVAERWRDTYALSGETPDGGDAEQTTPANDPATG